MRQGQQNRRGRGRNRSNKGHNPLTRSFESNGPDVKIRGTPAHIAEKYMSLARDASASGDPVLAENYLQHAEHYNRIIMTYREQQFGQGGDPNQLPRPVRPIGPEGFDADEFGDEDGGEEGGPEMGIGGQPNGNGGHQQQGQPYGGGHRDHQPRGYEGQPRTDDRPQRNDNNNNHQRHGRDRFNDQQRRYDRNDRNDRFDRNRDRDRGGFDRQDRRDRPERPEGQDRGDNRQDRMDRPDRGPDRDRQDRPDQRDRRPERDDMPVERSEQPRIDRVPEPIAAELPQPDVPRGEPQQRPRRERFAEGHEQPEFLRRPVRRPRREAQPAAAGDVPEVAEPAPKDETPV